MRRQKRQRAGSGRLGDTQGKEGTEKGAGGRIFKKHLARKLPITNNERVKYSLHRVKFLEKEKNHLKYTTLRKI